MHIVLLRYTENRARAGQFMDAHKAWIKRGFDDGIFLLVGSLEPELGGTILADGISHPNLCQRVGADPFVREGIATAEVLEVSPARADARLSFLVPDGVPCLAMPAEHPSPTILGPDGQPRCRWYAAAPEFLDYHDRE